MGACHALDAHQADARVPDLPDNLLWVRKEAATVEPEARDVGGARRVEHHGHRLELEGRGIHARVEHAKVEREPAHEHALELFEHLVQRVEVAVMTVLDARESVGWTIHIDRCLAGLVGERRRDAALLEQQRARPRRGGAPHLAPELMRVAPPGARDDALVPAIDVR